MIFRHAATLRHYAMLMRPDAADTTLPLYYYVLEITAYAAADTL